MHFALLFYLLMIKHAICDFMLQGRLQGSGNENKLFSRKKNLHALDHAIGTSLVFLVVFAITHDMSMVIPWIGILFFAVTDYVLHLIIDWRKNIITKKYKLTIEDRSFWKLTAIDQCFHYTCYFLYCWLYLTYWL
jgi:hypothetical protein